MHTAPGCAAAATKLGALRISGSTRAASMGENPILAPKKSEAVLVSR
jgi:hypothetical protein